MRWNVLYLRNKEKVEKIMLKKIVANLTIAALVLVIAGCSAAKPVDAAPAPSESAALTTESTAEPVTETKPAPFAYEHDPRQNPAAMEDIVENPDAVYGFSPNPESTRLGKFAEYDWTDPEAVAQYRQERIAYHESLESMMDILHEMRAGGSSIEEMARAVSAERNRLRLESYRDDPAGLEKVKQSNLETYGDENGPTADSLFEKYGSWEIVLQKAFSPNAGMDACTGLYDDYYTLYIELGLIQE